MKELWPTCKVVRGSPRHCQSQGGVERVNQTVQKKLGNWMETNKSKKWSIGCKFVAWLYNTSYHNAVKNLPFVLVFGQQLWLISSKIAHSKNFSNPHFLLQNLLVCYLVSSEWTLTLSNSLYSLRSAWSKSGY